MNRGVLVLLIAVAGIFYLSLKSKLRDEDVPREKLSAVINSPHQEVRPFISPDGNTLYFSRRHHPGNTGGSRDYQDIWVSHFSQGTWSEPEKLNPPLNNKKTNTLCSVTSDGSYALLLDSYKKVKTPLVQAYDSPAGWGAPMEVDIKNFTNRSSYYDFFYQEHLEVILSAVDDGRGYGDQDIHVSFKNSDGSYTQPMNLGPVLNSKKGDFAPFLAADGRTLYFASFGHQGYGGSDFYVSYRMDDSWKRWTRPKNLGPGINSELDENYLSVTADFKYVYFESYATGAEEKDIYRARLPGQFHPQNLIPQENSQQQQVIAQKQNTNKPATSNTALHSNPNKKPASGPAVSANRPGTNGNFQRERSNAASSSDLATGNLTLRKYLEDGQLHNKVLRNSYFPYNSYQLTVQGKTKLAEISKVLKNNPGLEILVEGHSDSWGTDEANLRVSYLRAQTAAHYLVDQGISGSRLQVTGLGAEHPLASNDDEVEGRELNRRVEVTLIAPATTYRFTVY